MKVVSLGFQCTLNMYLKKINKRKTAYPFDWILSTPKIVFELLKLLLIDNLDTKELVKEYFFKCDGRVNSKFAEHFYIDDNPNGKLHNTKNNLIFPHDEDSIETIEKYIRRFDRLKDDILNSNEEICFIYTSQSNLEGDGNFTIKGINQISNVYMYLNKIYELIGNIRNGKKYKMMIFDAVKNEDKNILNKNIILYELYSCENWVRIEHQLYNYISLFNDV